MPGDDIELRSEESGGSLTNAGIIHMSGNETGSGDITIHTHIPTPETLQRAAAVHTVEESSPDTSKIHSQIKEAAWFLKTGANAE